MSKFLEQNKSLIKSMVDVIREPILILDKNLIVMVANEAFYLAFQAEPQSIEHKLIYDLSDKHWDTPPFRKLLEEILPINKFFKGYELTNNFPFIGKKIMILNARQIHLNNKLGRKSTQIILLAMEDVTEVMSIASSLFKNNNQFEINMAKKTQKIEMNITALGIEINKLKKNASN